MISIFIAIFLSIIFDFSCFASAMESEEDSHVLKKTEGALSEMDLIDSEGSSSSFSSSSAEISGPSLFEWMPEEILLKNVLLYLEAEDLMSFGKTCSAAYRLIQDYMLASNYYRHLTFKHALSIRFVPPQKFLLLQTGRKGLQTVDFLQRRVFGLWRSDHLPIDLLSPVEGGSSSSSSGYRDALASFQKLYYEMVDPYIMGRYYDVLSHRKFLKNTPEIVLKDYAEKSILWYLGKLDTLQDSSEAAYLIAYLVARFSIDADSALFLYTLLAKRAHQGDILAAEGMADILYSIHFPNRDTTKALRWGYRDYDTPQDLPMIHFNRFVDNSVHDVNRYQPDWFAIIKARVAEIDEVLQGSYQGHSLKPFLDDRAGEGVLWKLALQFGGQTFRPLLSFLYRKAIRSEGGQEKAEFWDMLQFANANHVPFAQELIYSGVWQGFFEEHTLQELLTYHLRDAATENIFAKLVLSVFYAHHLQAPELDLGLGPVQVYLRGRANGFAPLDVYIYFQFLRHFSPNDLTYDKASYFKNTRVGQFFMAQLIRYRKGAIPGKEDLSRVEQLKLQVEEGSSGAQDFIADMVVSKLDESKYNPIVYNSTVKEMTDQIFKHHNMSMISKGEKYFPEHFPYTEGRFEKVLRHGSRGNKAAQQLSLLYLAEKIEEEVLWTGKYNQLKSYYLLLNLLIGSHPSISVVMPHNW